MAYSNVYRKNSQRILLSPLYIVKNRYRFNVQLTPNSSQNRLVGLVHEVDKTISIKALVTAAPKNSKANVALIQLLAKEWKLPKSSLSIIRGTSRRKKTVEIDHDSNIVQPVLENWVKKL